MNLGEVFVFELTEGTLPPKGSEYAKATEKARQFLEQAQEDDLHQPQIFTSYGNELCKLECHDKYGIQEMRKNHYFESVADKFKLIDDDTYPVVIVYDRKVQELLNKIKHRGLFTSDYRELQPYTVSIRAFEFRKHQKSKAIEQPIAGVNFYIWTGNYHPIVGIPITSDPSDVYLLKGEDSVF
jgi:CRISPR-associated endonuclease/helicase Cas3